MYTLYPAIKPYQTHELAVGKPHVLYVEEIGNPDGLPVIILHDGPGGAGDPNLRRFFDPQIFHMIIFDQRGCGRSTPHVELQKNTTAELLDDIETIREFLGLSRVILFGGGWGALLALLYAQLYPQSVANLILYRIFLGRTADLNWLYQQGANCIYPDYWEEFIAAIPPEQQNNIPEFYFNCLQGSNDLARMSAAKNWALWQANCSSLHPCPDLIEEYSDPHFALGLASLQTHYIKNHYFIEDNQVLIDAHKIRHLPAYIIQGRYDMVYPLAGAWELHQAMPASNLSIIREAGHSVHEPGIIDALIGASKLISKEDLDVC